MKQLTRRILGLAAYLVSATPLLTQAADWVPIKGNVRLADGTPICAMVLANGQYMFSCGGDGAYSLNVPLDNKGQVTLFAFADGFAPFRVTAGPNAVPSTVRTRTADRRSPQIAMTRDAECGANNWVRISGEIESFGGSPLCAMVLANGQHMFTCGASNGRYDLTVPADENGNITVFGFADGFQPYSETVTAPLCDTRFAVIDGVDLAYQFAEKTHSGTRACFLRVTANNTNSRPVLVKLWANVYEAPGMLAGAVNSVLQVGASAQLTTESLCSADTCGFDIGCDNVYDFDLQPYPLSLVLFL